MAAFQPALIHESIEDALRDAVRAIGGSKKAGPMLWPSLPIKEAENRINDCINPDRREKFSLAELMHLLRAAREVGYHGAMAYLGADAGYDILPIEPQDEQARLMREFNESTKALARIADRIEKLSAVKPRAVA